MARKRIYIGCALTNLPLEWREELPRQYNLLRDTLRQKKDEYEVLDFVGLINGTSQDVARHDTSCVERCSLFVALCACPSIGLGYEIGVATMLNKTVIAAVPKGVTVTRMVKGLDAVNPRHSFVEYGDVSELVRMVDEYFNLPMPLLELLQISDRGIAA